MKRDKELKRAIIKWLLDHEDEWLRVDECNEVFRAYIFDEDGNYLIGGKETAKFISNADKLLFD